MSSDLVRPSYADMFYVSVVWVAFLLYCLDYFPVAGLLPCCMVWGASLLLHCLGCFLVVWVASVLCCLGCFPLVVLFRLLPCCIVWVASLLVGLLPCCCVA